MTSGLEEMEAAVDVFEERLDKMDITDLEAKPEEKETVTEQQKSLTKR
jgi:hypothetical protein